MVKTKKIMGFARLVSCGWIAWILASHLEAQKLASIVILMIVLGFCFFLMEEFKNLGRLRNLYQILPATGAFLIAYNLSEITATRPKLESAQVNQIHWDKFSLKDFQKARKGKKPLFLRFTASWCLTCSFNDSVFKEAEVVKFFKEKGIVAMKADWSLRDPEISKTLKIFGSSSVPFYVFFANGAESPVILPSIISKKDILKLGQ
jgi:thiol:disulfide interchange protein DsbD